MLYVAGFATFFTGVALNVYTKNSKPIDAFFLHFVKIFLQRHKRALYEPDGASKNV